MRETDGPPHRHAPTPGSRRPGRCCCTRRMAGRIGARPGCRSFRMPLGTAERHEHAGWSVPTGRGGRFVRQRRTALALLVGMALLGGGGAVYAALRHSSPPATYRAPRVIVKPNPVPLGARIVVIMT